SIITQLLSTTYVTGMASSLPADVVRRLGDLFLDTDDVDYYMTMRGVCHGWRVSTDDPKTSPADPRFRLGRWVMLDERRPKSDEDERASGRLFLNTTTGRRVYKRLPRLDDYYFVTSTGGLIVLASRTAPHMSWTMARCPTQRTRPSLTLSNLRWKSTTWWTRCAPYGALTLPIRR
uniref:F-box domain-containing protein n=1 Tax=Aegilops tauschii subsp. strangulata TaxID=200361 RepID=A0A452XZ26_AEGTS